MIKLTTKPASGLFFCRSKSKRNRKLHILYFFCFFGMAACSSHQPAKHISHQPARHQPTGHTYDPSPKDKQKPTSAWDFKRDGVNESYSAPPKKIAQPKKIFTGYEDKETCTTNECPPCYKKEVCAVKKSPDGSSKGKCKVTDCEHCETETCTTEKIPVYSA